MPHWLTWFKPFDTFSTRCSVVGISDSVVECIGTFLMGVDSSTLASSLTAINLVYAYDQGSQRD
jgi:hypothetical protein